MTGLVSAPATATADELLARAREGDGNAFAQIADGYRNELRSHCYRMLGSVHDAEDAVQEALMRAWRGLPGFEDRSSVRSWLYSICTNAALDIARRRQRELPADFGPAASAGTNLDAPLTERSWLEPYPVQWLPDDGRLSPEARYEQRESVELAFVVSLQHLMPLQRAVLLLRDVVGMSTIEISDLLGRSAASVNSALQRARATLRTRLPERSQQQVLRALGDERVKVLARRYADAIERGDADALVSMLTSDATWSMPPVPTWFRGHEAITSFLVRYPLTERWMHLPAQANGQLAVGCYLPSEEGTGFVPAVIDVLTLDGDKIAGVTAFLTAEALRAPQAPAWVAGADLFTRFGLPTRLP